MSPLQEAHREERRWPGVFLEVKSEHSHPSLLLTFNLWQKSRKQGAGKAKWPPWGTPAGMRRPCPASSVPSVTGELRVPSKVWASRDSLPSQVAAAAGLEADHDVRDLQVLLLLQVGQRGGLEEDLALADVVQVAAELQSFDLEDESWLLTMGPPWSPGARPRQGRGLERGLALMIRGQPPPGAGRVGVGGRQEGAGGGQQGAGKESDLQRNAETQP